MKLAVNFRRFSVFLLFPILIIGLLLYSPNSASSIPLELSEEEAIRNELKTVHASAYEAASVGNESLFKTLSRRQLILAEALKDSFDLGEAHWNLGLYYLTREILDSSYFHYHTAYRYFKHTDTYLAAKMKYNLAYISNLSYNYTESEILLFEALPVFIEKKKYIPLYQSYNLLAVLSKNLNEYEDALIYYEKAADYIRHLDSPEEPTLSNLNNRGNIFFSQGRYSEADALYSKILEYKDLKITYPLLYARVLNNYARNRMEIKDVVGIENDLHEALYIRKEHNLQKGIISSHLNLSTFYLRNCNASKALYHAQEAYQLGISHALSREVMRALVLLAEIQPLEKAKYLEKYIGLAKESRENERKIRNKNTRILFETEQFKTENLALKREKVWIRIMIVGLIIIFLLTVFILRQRHRHRTLAVSAKAQEAKTQLLELAIKEKENAEMVRQQERNRIAFDLHNDVLSDLFGIRLNWGAINSKLAPEVLPVHQTYLRKLQELEITIRGLSHELYDMQPRDEETLQKRINHLCEKWEAQANFDLNVVFVGTESVPLDRFRIDSLCLVLEEAFMNVQKHANAREVCLKIERTSDSLHVLFSDDGKGFDATTDKTGIGHRIMKDRLSMIDGCISISSSRFGTTLAITLTLT